jgi:hypothetical protein
METTQEHVHEGVGERMRALPLALTRAGDVETANAVFGDKGHGLSNARRG